MRGGRDKTRGIFDSASEVKRARRAAKVEKREVPSRARASRAALASKTVQLNGIRASSAKSPGQKIASVADRVPAREPRIRTDRSGGNGRARRADRPDRPDRSERPALPLRIGLVSIVFAASAVALVGRAAQLQLVDHAKYENVVERQATLSASIQAKRGVIKDRHGSELAITVDVDTVFAEPKLIPPEEKRELAHDLARVLQVPEKPLLAKLNKDRAFVYLKRRVDPSVAARVRALGRRGVSTQPEPKRFYANRDLAAHVLGFSGEEGDGRAGIEREFDGQLRGKSYEVPGLRDALGNKVLSEGFVPHSVLEGADVHLTVDRQIQFAAEVALAGAVIQAKAKGGVALVLEPKTGDILALASYPTFNPNNLAGATADEQLNRAVSAVFEPGSTMKMVTIAGALEDHLIEPDDRVDCEQGKMRIGRRTIADSHKGYGELTIGEIMKVSSNVCTAKIGLEMGAKRLHHWLTAFGLGEQTGVELPGELHGMIRPAETWREIALANIAFGQGISVTPLQIAQAASTIAHDGLRVAPRLVEAVVDKSGRRVVPERPAPVRVVSAKTAEVVRRMMVEVTQKGGTAEAAAIPGFSVAGKTGTAQKIDPVSRAYSHELYVSSFVGFVPAEHPEVVILVMVDEPKGAYYGGVVAAPAFKQIALAALASREVFPDDPTARESFLASYRPPEPEQAQPFEDAADAAPLADGPESAGQIQELTAENDEPRSERLDSALSTEALAMLGVGDRRDRVEAKGEVGERPERGRMPNFAGLKLHEVLNRSSEVHCDPVLVGTGRVVGQQPAAGTTLPPGTRCELKLAPSEE